MSDDWIRLSWSCSECPAVISANVKGDASEVRVVHLDDGHELLLPKPTADFRFDVLPGLDGQQVVEGGR